MKIKNAIVGMILPVMFLFSAASGIAQDTASAYIEEQGEVQDSLTTTNILLLGDEYQKDNTPVIVILVAGAVIVAGGVFYVLKRRKKSA